MIKFVFWNRHSTGGIMALSIFAGKENKPEEQNLINTLGGMYDCWLEIKNFVIEKYPLAQQEWNFAGKNYGWSFRLKDKKRVIIYLIPCDGFFKIALVFGDKATNKALNGNISESIKEEIRNAKVYAEGRGFRIDIKNESLINDIKYLVEIKLEY